MVTRQSKREIVQSCNSPFLCKSHLEEFSLFFQLVSSWSTYILLWPLIKSLKTNFWTSDCTTSVLYTAKSFLSNSSIHIWTRHGFLSVLRVWYCNREAEFQYSNWGHLFPSTFAQLRTDTVMKVWKSWYQLPCRAVSLASVSQLYGAEQLLQTGLPGGITADSRLQLTSHAQTMSRITRAAQS